MRQPWHIPNLFQRKLHETYATLDSVLLQLLVVAVFGESGEFPDLGTMEDAEEMIAALAEHGVGVMFDMVLNHVSTEHEWFKRAQAGELIYKV